MEGEKKKRKRKRELGAQRCGFYLPRIQPSRPRNLWQQPEINTLFLSRRWPLLDGCSCEVNLGKIGIQNFGSPKRESGSGERPAATCRSGPVSGPAPASANGLGQVKQTGLSGTRFGLCFHHKVFTSCRHFLPTVLSLLASPRGPVEPLAAG